MVNMESNSTVENRFTDNVVNAAEATCSGSVMDQNVSLEIPRLNQQMTEEYITQFFGFTPKAFCDSIYNALYDALHDGIDAFQKSLLVQFKNAVTEEELCLSSEKVLEVVMPKTEKICEKLEAYLMKNIFSIPKGMLLPEDEIHRSVCAKSEDEKKLDRELGDLQKEILNSQYMIHCLQQQNLETEIAIEEYSKMCTMLEEMEKMYANHGIASISDIRLVKDRACELTAAISETQNEP